MSTTEPGTSFDSLAPFIASDLVCPPQDAQALGDAKGLLVHKQARVLFLYAVSGACSVAALVLFIWLGALLTGLPLEPGGALHESYPLSFVRQADVAPWDRYFQFAIIVSLSGWATWPVGWVRRRLVRAWARP